MARPKAELVLTDDERQTLTTWAEPAQEHPAAGPRGPGSSWPAPRAWTTRPSPPGSASARPPSAPGGGGSSTAGWRAWPTSPGPVPRGRSPTPTSSGSSPGRWRPSPRTPPTGAPAAWPRRAGLSQSAVGRIWRAFGLKPHRAETFKLSTDPFFVEKVRDVVGLYLTPPERAIVLCVDEKSQVQALDRTQPLLPMAPGPGRAAHPRLRPPRHHLAVRGPERGHRRGDRQVPPPAPAPGVPQVPRRHRRRACRRSRACEIHLVLDNYATHKTPAVKRWFLRHPEYHLHFTPTSGSWLNQVERFFAEITEKRIRRGAFRSVAALERAIGDYLERAQREPQAVRVDRRRRPDPRPHQEGL